MATQGTNKHLWEIRPPSPLTLKPPGVENRDKGWPRTTKTIVCRRRPVQSIGRLAVSQQAAMSGESSGLLLGVATLEPKRERLSVNKGTREAQSSRVVAQSPRFAPRQTPPMRRLGGGASVVVRGRESRPHGEGRQIDSCWMTEAFGNRRGLR